MSIGYVTVDGIHARLHHYESGWSSAHPLILKLVLIASSRRRRRLLALGQEQRVAVYVDLDHGRVLESPCRVLRRRELGIVAPASHRKHQGIELTLEVEKPIRPEWWFFPPGDDGTMERIF